MKKTQQEKQLLVFSYGLPLLCLLLAWRQYAKHGQTWWVEFFIAIGFTVLLMALFFPAGVKLIFKYWMKMAQAIGQVVTVCILSVFFFLIITPVSIILFLMKKDFMKLGFKQDTDSYWIKREIKNEDHTQQF